MAKRKTNSYWLSLIAMLLVVSMVLSVGDTQARYVNTTVWNTVVYPTSELVSSNCLRPEGQVILLGEMELDALEIPFELESTQDVSGKLEATVDLDELLQVELSHETVELDAYEFLTVTMTLIPTEKAISAVRPEMDVDILVTWGDMLSGTFRVTLPELTEEDLGIIPTEPEITEPEVTEPEATQPEATEPEVTEPDPTEPDATEPDPTEPETTEPETSEPAESEPDETEEPTRDTQATEDNNSNDQTGGTPADTNTNGETSAEDETTQLVTLSVVTPLYMSRAAVGRTAFTGNRMGMLSSASNAANVDAAAPMPAENTPDEPDEGFEAGATEGAPTEESTSATEDATDSEEESTSSTEDATAPTQETTAATEEPSSEPTQSQPPASGGGDDEETAIGVKLQTVESFDDRANLPLLITPGEDTTRVRLGLGVAENGVVKVSEFPAFTRYSLDGESYFMLYFGGVIELDTTGVESKSLLLDLGAIGLSRQQDVILAAEAYERSKWLGSTSTYSVPCADIDYAMSTQVMTNKVPMMIFQLPDDWKNCHLDYAVSMLVADQETGVMGYQVVELDAKSLKATHSYGAASPHWLTLELGKEKPLPGTYRLSMSWTYEGICFAKTQTTFFINYSGSR